MKNNLEQQFSEDLLIAQSSNSVREDSDPIPVDLLIDIFSRVPAYSIARFRCVSKSWESILRRPDFTELFLTKSVSRPRLLFVVPVNKDSDNEGPVNEESFVFSSPQPQNPNDNSSLVATPYKNCFRLRKYIPWDISPQVVRGLVFLRHWRKNSQVIFNPVTGESIFLPSVKASGITESYFGFDPISKQFKVLCITWSRDGTPDTHRILTLEIGIKRRWRTIQDPIPHDSMYYNICINGVLYYGATFPDGCSKMVCFDFRFEKYSFVKLHKDIVPDRRLKLFNCKGKLGAHQYIEGGCEERFALWVLEDAGEHKWSKRICILPSKVDNGMFLGMTGTGEIVFSPRSAYHPFCISYYIIERNTVTRFNIQGFEKFEHSMTSVSTFLDYEENLKVV